MGLHGCQTSQPRQRPKCQRRRELLLPHGKGENMAEAAYTYDFDPHAAPEGQAVRQPARSETDHAGDDTVGGNAEPSRSRHLSGARRDAGLRGPGDGTGRGAAQDALGFIGFQRPDRHRAADAFPGKNTSGQLRAFLPDRLHRKVIGPRMHRYSQTASTGADSNAERSGYQHSRKSVSLTWRAPWLISARSTPTIKRSTPNSTSRWA